MKEEYTHGVSVEVFNTEGVGDWAVINADMDNPRGKQSVDAEEMREIAEMLNEVADEMERED